MGEVYRGRDSRLKRGVALKILPTTFAADPERLARFEREAQALAAIFIWKRQLCGMGTLHDSRSSKLSSDCSRPGGSFRASPTATVCHRPQHARD
jgi:serine/threonine protein kinase